MRDDNDCGLAWSLFEDTGTVEAYLLYHRLAAENSPGREELHHAVQNRRPGDPRNSCR